MTRFMSRAALVAAVLLVSAPVSAADKFANQAPLYSSPAVNGAAVTPNDSTPLTQPTRMVWVGGAGALSVVLAGDTSPITLSGIPAGTMLNIRAATIRATGTTATLIVALW